MMRPPTSHRFQEDPNPNTPQAAQKRQELLDAQKAEYLAKGGKVEFVPSLGMESNYRVKRSF